MKIVDTDTLRWLIYAARTSGYNRQLDPDAIDRVVDEGGQHVISAVLLHEHKAGEPCEPHARCLVFVKQADTMDPAEEWLDIDLDIFSQLPDFRKDIPDGAS